MRFCCFSTTVFLAFKGVKVSLRNLYLYSDQQLSKVSNVHAEEITIGKAKYTFHK